MYPEFRGNGVMASLGNISENPRLAMLFIDFEEDTIGLHVNGDGRMAEAAEIDRYRRQAPDMDSPSYRRAVTWVAIDVECAYVHCSKHIPRFAKVPHKSEPSTHSGRKKGGDYFGTATGNGAAQES